MESSWSLFRCVPYDGKFEPEVMDTFSWIPLLSVVVYMYMFSAGMYHPTKHFTILDPQNLSINISNWCQVGEKCFPTITEVKHLKFNQLSIE